MKHFFTSIFLLMSMVAVQAQFTAATNEGVPITDGSVFTYNQTGDTNGLFTFNITNNAPQAIHMKLEFVSMQNTDGSGTYLCLFGVCLPPGGITVGESYTGPENEIAPGATSTTDNHFYNTDEGDGTNYPVEYVFRLYQEEDTGKETSESITFTYRYDPNYNAVEDEQILPFKLYPNVTSSVVNIEVSSDVKGLLMDTQGRILSEYHFTEGKNTIDVSALPSQLYYLLLSDVNNQQSIAKIIVK